MSFYTKDHQEIYLVLLKSPFDMRCYTLPKVNTPAKPGTEKPGSQKTVTVNEKGKSEKCMLSFLLNYEVPQWTFHECL